MDSTSTRNTAPLCVAIVSLTVITGACWLAPDAAASPRGRPAALGTARYAAPGRSPLLPIAAAGLLLSILCAASSAGGAPDSPPGRKRIADVIGSLHAIVWVADATTLQTLFVSAGADEILGYREQPWGGDSDFLRCHIHPDDRREVVARIRDGTERDPWFALEYRALDARGNVVWLHNTVRVTRDAHGHPRWLHGAIVDITALKRREEALRRENAGLAAVLQHAAAGVAYLDEDLTIRHANAAWAEAVGVPAEALEGQSGLEAIRDPQVRAALRRVWDTQQPGVARSRPCGPSSAPGSPAAVFDWHLSPAADLGEGTRGLVITLLPAGGPDTAEQQESAGRDRLLATVAHELRNPVGTVLAGLEVLRRAVITDPHLAHVLEVMERSARLQARLVADLGQLGAMRHHTFRIETAPVALDAVVTSAADAVRLEAERGALALHVDATPGVWVRGDADRLYQVIVNLLVNAVRYTPPGGEIRVAVRQVVGAGTPAASFAQVQVSDTGMGISPELLPRLFEMFVQGPPPRQGRQGLGIGLALVKAIVERHGGQVRAESDGLGQGSCFTVELPLIPAPEQPET